MDTENKQVYGKWAGNPEGKPAVQGKCKKAVYGDSFMSRGHQCNNKAKKDGWCMVHHPDTAAKRDAKNQDKWDKQWAARRRPSERLALFKDSLEKIAEGTFNDPAGFAQMILEQDKEDGEKLK